MFLGSILSITGSLASTIGQINPFRYRSYYYDTESGWYYLQSRYYDPQVGRFLNTDEPAIVTTTQSDLLSVNLYAYCENNPIISIDPTGYASQKLIGGGFQFSLQISFGGKNFGVGIEIVWYWSNQVTTGQSRWIPFIYFYAEVSVDISCLKEAMMTYYNKIKIDLKKLLQKPSFSAGVSIFGIWANSKFISPDDYTKVFSSSCVAAFGYKAYKSWSDTCTVYGAGKYWGVSGKGISLSKSYYWLIGYDGKFSYLYDKVQSEV